MLASSKLFGADKEQSADMTMALRYFDGKRRADISTDLRSFWR
jgi:hypothetical protein